jgi:acetyl esterase/lipase
VLWIHGGGYVIGTAAQDDQFRRLIADRLGIVVASVDYRLAPEHPFPTPLHDCYAALGRLAGQPDVDPERIAIGGASAGAGLAAALARLAKERGEIRPVLQLLASPVLDDRTTTRTDIDQRPLRMWNTANNRFGRRSYLGPWNPANQPPAVPVQWFVTEVTRCRDPAVRGHRGGGIRVARGSRPCARVAPGQPVCEPFLDKRSGAHRAVCSWIRDELELGVQ